MMKTDLKIWLPLLLIAVTMIGCVPPPVPVKPEQFVELPQYGLDFWVVTDKKVYQIGEPVTLGIKVKNSDTKPHTLRFAPGTDVKPYPVPDTIAYGVSGDFGRLQGLTLEPITITVQPNSEMQIEALNWTWDQTDDLLKEQVGPGGYLASATIGRLDVDGQRIGVGTFRIEQLEKGAPWFGAFFSIIHPVVDILEKQHGIVFRRGGSFYYVEPQKPFRVMLGVENRSMEAKTVSIKPIGDYPTVRVQFFGPINRRDDYPLPTPPKVAMKEARDSINVTINPNRIYTVFDWEWDQRDMTTGNLVLPDSRYLMVLEVCGEIEVNGQRVGSIQSPLKLFGHEFETGKEKEVIHIDPYPDKPIGETVSPPISGLGPQKPPPPPDLLRRDER